MKKRTLLFLSLITSSGCLWPARERQPVRIYDLQVPRQQHVDIPEASPYPPLQIGPFTALGPYGERMIYRKSPHRLVLDEYNRWIEAPTQLVRKALFQKLQYTGLFQRIQVVQASRNELLLTGQLIRLEVSPDLQAILELQLVLHDYRQDRELINQIFERNIPLSAQTPEAFAAATAQACDDIAEELLLLLNNTLLN